MLDRLQTWSKTSARSRHAYLAAAAIGLAVCLIALGPGHLLGTSAYWDLPLTDHRAYLMGYRYFLHEPWHWPVFVTHTMNVPFGKSIAFTDSIPIWALINKAIATIIPPWGGVTDRAYLGLWYGLIYSLQAMLAVANLRALGQRSWGATIVTALLFVAVPSWLFRHVHASMSAHFMILWALYLYLRTPSGEPAPRRLRIVQLVELLIAALVNPYHAVMSFGIFAASVLRSRKIKGAAIWLPAGFAVIAVAAWFASYFTKEAKLAMFGFDVASTNVLSPVIPLRSGFVGDAAWVDPTGYQYEGYAYLGVGFLVMLALFLPRIRSLGGVIKRHPFLFAVALGAWVFALSNHVWIGSHELVAYPMPSKLGWLADQFRSPGRFVWVPMYVLLVFLSNRTLSRFTSGWRLAIVPVLVVLQLVDASGQWAQTRSVTREEDHPRLPLAAWRPLVHAHAAVYVFPTYDCILDGTVDVDIVSTEIQYLASEQAIPINGVYSARPTRNCDVDTDYMLAAEPAPDTLYVFLAKVAGESARFEVAGATCGAFKFGRVCSKNAPAMAEALRAGALTTTPLPPSPDLAIGQRIELGNATSEPYLELGWSWPETTSRWTDGTMARLEFHLTGTVPPEVALKIQLSAALCGKRATQDVDVTINGTVVTTLHFDASANDPSVIRSIPIKAEVLRSPTLVLGLRPRDVRTPVKLGCNADARRLGVAVQRLWFE